MPTRIWPIEGEALNAAGDTVTGSLSRMMGSSRWHKGA